MGSECFHFIPALMPCLFLPFQNVVEWVGVICFHKLMSIAIYGQMGHEKQEPCEPLGKSKAKQWASLEVNFCTFGFILDREWNTYKKSCLKTVGHKGLLLGVIFATVSNFCSN